MSSPVMTPTIAFAARVASVELLHTAATPHVKHTPMYHLCCCIAATVLHPAYSAPLLLTLAKKHTNTAASGAAHRDAS